MSTISVGEPTVVGAAWRYRLLVIATLAACVGVVGIYVEARPSAYSAMATMVLQDPHSVSVFANASNSPPDRYTGDQIAVLKSPQLAAAAAALGAQKKPPLGLTADEISKDSVVAGTPLSGNLVQLTFTAGNQATALAGVDAIKTAYENTVHDAVSAELTTLLGQIDTELSSINVQLTTVATKLASQPSAPEQQALAQQQAALNGRRDTLNAKRDQVAVDAASGSNGVALYLPPQTTIHSSKLVAALPILSVAAVLGLVAGVLAAFVLASRRRLFRGVDEPEILLGAPLVAEIPMFGPSHLPAADGAPASAATAFRRAALFIQGSQVAGGGSGAPHLRAPVAASRLLIVSATRREGRSTVAANLGIALSDNGLSTLLIDADPITGGLTQLLYDRFELAPVLDRVGLAPAGLSLADVFLPDNSHVRLALLRAERARLALDDADRDERLKVLESTFSVVIIDAPPLSDAGPYWPLVRRADSAIVLLTDQTPVAQVEEVSRLLSAIEMQASGYIYNHRPRLRRAPPTLARRASDLSASSPGSRPAGVGLVPRRAGGGTRAPAEHANHEAGVVAQISSRQPPGLRAQAEEPFES